MNIKLSIIVPVYNGERYIAACLNSVVSQIHDEVELIVINDGSIDATDHIITTDFKANIDNGSLVYLPTENAGVSAARNLGLDRASGEYIAFVDADDIVSSNYLQTVLNAIKQAPSIIEFGYRTIDELGNIIKASSFVHTKFGKHAAKSLLNTVFSACIWYPFLRVFKRQLFNETRFPVGVRFCEDLITLSAIYKQADDIVSLSAVLYDYRINSAGATFNIKPDYAQHLISFYRKIADDQSFANKALKVSLAYVIRRCIADTNDTQGRMPSDIESDIRKLVFTPSLFLHIRIRYMAYALWGPLINNLKVWLR